MHSKIEHTLASIILGPSAYIAHVELYTNNKQVEKFEASPNVAMLAIDRHIATHAPKQSLRSRARLWMEVNSEFGPFVLPHELRSTVRTLLADKHKSSRDRFSSHHLGAWIQAHGLPLPTPYVVNVIPFAAAGVLLDVATITPAPFGSFGSIAAFYLARLLSNAAQPEMNLGLTSNDYRLDIRKQRNF